MFDEIKEKANNFARKNKKTISKKLTDTNIFPSETNPISIFMAGSPGAGKTEFSKRLVEFLERNNNKKFIRIDPDDLRSLFEDYEGFNSFLFQSAVSIITDSIHDSALKQNQNFIFDGTFSKYEKSKINIIRSINKNRKIEIFYIYQDPLLSWDFVKKREEKEGRKIRKEDFINHFLNSKIVTNRIKKEFGDKVELTLIIKNNNSLSQKTLQEVENIDNYIKDYYSFVTLKNMIN
ncbi:MAG: zeta toxin family protein [Candidatus Pacebacteria bacterium]|nr:zeta toxin family protein [Candidatus Paceibacterota bacterium]